MSKRPACHGCSCRAHLDAVALVPHGGDAGRLVDGHKVVRGRQQAPGPVGLAARRVALGARVDAHQLPSWYLPLQHGCRRPAGAVAAAGGCCARQVNDTPPFDHGLALDLIPQKHGAQEEQIRRLLRVDASKLAGCVLGRAVAGRALCDVEPLRRAAPQWCAAGGLVRASVWRSCPPRPPHQPSGSAQASAALTLPATALLP